MLKFTNKIIIIIIIASIIYLFIPEITQNLSSTNLKPLNSNYLLGTDSTGKDILKVVAKTISLLLFNSLNSALIALMIIMVIHFLILIFPRKKILKQIPDISYQVLNVLPVLLITVVTAGYIKIGIMEIIIICTLFNYAVMYRINSNLFNKIINEPNTKFIQKLKIKKKYLFFKLYYLNLMENQLVNSFKVSFINSISIQASLDYLGYGLDENKYYTFGRYIKENYFNILNNNVYSIILPGIILVLVLFLIFKFIKL
jgi:ABC-type dipeptide/oligopeptide/nickel transport system permease subunit